MSNITGHHVSLLCSGMKPLNCSVEACHWEDTGQTSATTIGVLQDLRLLITYTSFWGGTTTLGRRWLATRPCSCSGSSSRHMSSKTSRDIMGRRTFKTVAICIGITSVFMSCYSLIHTWSVLWAHFNILRRTLHCLASLSTFTVTLSGHIIMVVNLVI